jgi:hypothetical protein
MRAVQDALPQQLRRRCPEGRFVSGVDGCRGKLWTRSRIRLEKRLVSLAGNLNLAAPNGW